MCNDLRLIVVVFTAVLVLAAGCRVGDRSVSAKSSAEEVVETVEDYWPDGTVRLRRQVLRSPDGTLINHGSYTRWYDNGAKEYEAVFVRGAKHGIATLWHKNGRKWTEGHYVHGQRHGGRYVWDENGLKRKEEHYADGKPHGTWTVWDKHGKIKWRGGYDHGVPRP